MRTDGATVTLAYEPSDTINAVKAEVQCKTGKPPAEQRLVYGGKQLQDGHTLADYGIGREATLDVSMRGLGGGPKTPKGSKTLANQPKIGQFLNKGGLAGQPVVPVLVLPVGVAGRRRATACPNPSKPPKKGVATKQPAGNRAKLCMHGKRKSRYHHHHHIHRRHHHRGITITIVIMILITVVLCRCTICKSLTQEEYLQLHGYVTWNQVCVCFCVSA